MGTTPAHVAPRSTYGRCARSSRLAEHPCSRALRAAGLWARLLCSPQTSVAARIAHIASTNPHQLCGSHLGKHWCCSTVILGHRTGHARISCAPLAPACKGGGVAQFFFCSVATGAQPPYNRVWQACATCACPVLGAGEMRPSLFR